MGILRFKSYLAPRARPLYVAVADAVGAALGVETAFTQASSYDEYVDDTADVSFVCGLPYVMFERAGQIPAVPVAAPVLIGERYSGLPIYFSDVVVSAAAPYESFLDLRGASWGYNELQSQSGYGVMRHHLQQLGETSGFFGDVVETGSHAGSLRAVVAGEIDAASIDSQVLAMVMAQDPSLSSQLKIVESVGPSTIQPVTVSSRLSIEIRDQIGATLGSLHENPVAANALRSTQVARFVRIDPSGYDDIRAMVEAAVAEGFTEVR